MEIAAETKLALQVKDHQLAKKMQRMGYLVDHYLFVRRQNIIRAQNRLDVSIPRFIITRNQRLDEYIEKIRRLSLKQLEKEKHRIDFASQKGAMSDPAAILKKGYTIFGEG
jgi:exonuclease VII large subunit